jgi:hypothetical protein
MTSNSNIPNPVAATLGDCRILMANAITEWLEWEQENGSIPYRWSPAQETAARIRLDYFAELKDREFELIKGH